jgi:hypothetical protein
MYWQGISEMELVEWGKWGMGSIGTSSRGLNSTGMNYNGLKVHSHLMLNRC